MEGGLQASTKVSHNEVTVRAKNPSSHPVYEDMQAKEEKNSLGGETGLMAPENKETNLPTDNHQLQHQEVTSPGRAIEPVTQEASAATDENKQSELIEENHKANRKVKLEFASSVVFLGFSELFCIMFLPKNSANENILKAVSILGSLASGAGVFLLIHTFYMLAPSNTCTHPIHHTISKCLIISCTALILASLAPLSLLPSPYNILIPIVLGTVLLSLGVHLYLRLKTNDQKTEKDQTQYEKQMKELTRLSELCAVVVNLSSAGLIGLLSAGIHINGLNHVLHPAVLASTLLLFTSFSLSAYLMFLLVLLAFVAHAIAFTFLKWYTVMAFIPVLIVYAVWRSIELYTRDPHNIQDTLGEEELKLAYTKASKITSMSFAGIIAIFSGYIGSDEKNMHLNICMIFMASSFLSGESLMLLSYKSSTRSHIGFAVSILTYFAISLLVFGAFTIFILMFMQLY